jgi:hypothetical protein
MFSIKDIMPDVSNYPLMSREHLHLLFYIIPQSEEGTIGLFNLWKLWDTEKCQNGALYLFDKVS